MISKEEKLAIIDKHIHMHHIDLFDIELNIAKLEALEEDFTDYAEKYSRIEKCVHVLLDKRIEVNASVK